MRWLRHLPDIVMLESLVRWAPPWRLQTRGSGCCCLISVRSGMVELPLGRWRKWRRWIADLQARIYASEWYRTGSVSSVGCIWQVYRAVRSRIPLISDFRFWWQNQYLGSWKSMVPGTCFATKSKISISKMLWPRAVRGWSRGATGLLSTENKSFGSRIPLISDFGSVIFSNPHCRKNSGLPPRSGPG